MITPLASTLTVARLSGLTVDGFMTQLHRQPATLDRLSRVAISADTTGVFDPQHAFSLLRPELGRAVEGYVSMRQTNSMVMTGSRFAVSIDLMALAARLDLPGNIRLADIPSEVCVDALSDLYADMTMRRLFDDITAYLGGAER